MDLRVTVPAHGITRVQDSFKFRHGVMVRCDIYIRCNVDLFTKNETMTVTVVASGEWRRASCSTVYCTVYVYCYRNGKL